MDGWNLLYNKIVFLVFECIWIEDGIYPEYKFSSAFFNLQDAENYLKRLRQRSKDYDYLHKIIEHKIVKNEFGKPLFWNKKYERWTDHGAFMTVSINQILKNLS